MRTTLNIDDELLKEAKIAAIRRGSTLTALIERALRKEVGELPPDQRTHKSRKTVLPAQVDPTDTAAVSEFLSFVNESTEHIRALGPFPSRAGKPRRVFNWADTSSLIEELEGPLARP